MFWVGDSKDMVLQDWVGRHRITEIKQHFLWDLSRKSEKESVLGRFPQIHELFSFKAALTS